MRDNRKHPIRGLCRRNGKFLARITVEDDAGRKAVKWVARWVGHKDGGVLIGKVYGHWARIFNNDGTLTRAVLDRLLHHADTVIIEGKSYRMKDQIEAP